MPVLLIARVCSIISASTTHSISTSHNMMQLFVVVIKKIKKTTIIFNLWTFCCNKALPDVLPLDYACRKSMFYNHIKQSEMKAMEMSVCSFPNADAFEMVFASVRHKSNGKNDLQDRCIS